MECQGTPGLFHAAKNFFHLDVGSRGKNQGDDRSLGTDVLGRRGGQSCMDVMGKTLSPSLCPIIPPFQDVTKTRW